MAEMEAAIRYLVGAMGIPTKPDADSDLKPDTFSIASCRVLAHIFNEREATQDCACGSGPLTMALDYRRAV